MISIVDDDPSVCRALKRLLHSLGYDVETFSSGVDFLASSPSKNPECLILDIHMAGMNGFELQEKLLEQKRNIPIVFVTALDDEQTRQKATRSGAIAFLRKPFDDQSLIAAIRKAANSVKS
jgi:FixJ family two-component response regulator